MAEGITDGMGKTRDGKKDIIYYLLMAVLATAFLGSGGMLLGRYLSGQRQEADFNGIASMFPAAQSPGRQDAAGPGRSAGSADRKQGNGPGKPPVDAVVSPEQWKLWWEQEAEQRFPVYRSLKKQNPDLVGWVRIEGTPIDYPVMQTPDSPDYYLRRGFDQKKSSYGVPYMAEGCHYGEPGTNLLVYGHHMKNGAMFAALSGYTEESYYREHPYIQFDTVDQAGSFEIAAAVRVDASGDPGLWRDLLFPSEEKAWERAWEAFGEQSFYRTGVNLEYGDRLLALVTCEYTLKDGRLMVVARKIR